MSSKFAIVGISCLFPGADTPDAFWDNLRAGVDSRAEGGPEIFGPADPGSADGSSNGRKGTPDPDHAITCVRGGFVTGFEFDPTGFHLRPEDLAGLDRVFHWSLHVAREALRDSGHDDRPELLARTGLVVGDYSFPTPASARISLPLVHEAVLEGLRRSGHPAPAPGPLLDPATVSPADARVSGAPARLAATALGLGGPRYALDAACSSALYALKLACDHLAAGQADLVLAGGVCAPDPTLIHLSFSDLHAYPQNGVSQPFDARSTGILTGQGAGMVAVRRLADAVADGDRIYAVIDGIGLSNDGAGRHLLVPNPAGQLRSYELAYAQAGFGPEQVDYLECHATGTPVGDGTEAESVAAWFGTRGTIPPLGSVKGNLGHLLTVAGLSSLLKVILAMGHGHLPPTIGIDRPLSTPGAGEVPVVRAGRDWPDRGPGPRRAAVSAFGFGGTNAHVVLSQRPDTVEAGIAEPFAPPALEVIGLGAHFGTLADVTAFERALHDGTDAFRPLPEHRWRGLEDTSGGTLERAGLHRAALPEGGFVDRIELDPADHRIPPSDLRNYNLQHALMSKVADEALRDAGYDRTVPAGRRAPEPRRIAVVVAMEIEPSAHLHLARYGLGDFLGNAYADAGLELTGDQLTALAAVAREGVHEPIVANEVLSYIGNIMASRISSLWNLTGPSFTVSSDGAGTAEALQIAQLLLLDESVEAVLVGAVDLAGSPENLLLRGEKPVSGAGLSFGDGQRGRRIGEGAGAVVLRRPEAEAGAGAGARADAGAGPGRDPGAGPGPGADPSTGPDPSVGPGADSSASPGSGQDADADAGPGDGSAPGADAGPDADAGSGAGPWPGATAGPGPGPSTGPGVNPGAGRGPDTDAGPDADPGPQPGSAAGPSPSAGPGAGRGPDASANPHAGRGADTDAGPDAGPRPQPGPAAGPGPSAGPGASPGAGRGPDASANPHAGRGADTDAGPDAGPGPRPGTAASHGPGRGPRARRAYARIESVAVRHAVPVGGVLPEADAGALAGAAGEALVAAGIGPAEVGYVEAHAGGTAGQDSAELAALAQVYPAGSGAVALGSAKAQLGDTQAAGAMAGLLRAVLCLHHAYVPGAPGWRRPAPELADDFAASAFHVPDASRPWLRTAQGERRYAAVSAIGSDGAHAHVVLSADRTRGEVARSDWRKAGGPVLLPLGAPDLDGLLTEVDRHLGLLAEGADPYRLGRAAAERLPGSALRVVLVGRDAEQLCAQLELAARDLPGAAAKGEEWTTPAGSCFAPRPIGPEGKVALVYPGAFNSYPGLGQDFFRVFPSLLDGFEAEATDPDRLFRAAQLYPRTQVTPDRRDLMALEGRLGEDIPFMLATGTTFAILYTDLVRELLGVRAHGAFGYSLGESSMLFATGGWQRSARRDDRISATPLFRDRLSGPRRTVRELWRLPEDTPDEAVWGSFVLLDSADRITAALTRPDTPYDKVFLTHVNTPREAVIAGDPVQCRALVEELGCPSARSPVGSVMHCPVVDGELAGLAELNDHPTGSPDGLDLLSAYDYGSVTSTELERSEVARRIARTLRGTIDFPRLVRTAYDRGYRYFVEVGPGATCTRWVHDTLGDAGHVAMPVDRRGVPAARSVAQLAARLTAHGLPVDLAALLGPDPAPDTARPARLRVPVGGGAPIPAGIAARAAAASTVASTAVRPEPVHAGAVSVHGSTEPAASPVDVKDAQPARAAAVSLEVPAPMPADPSLDDIEVITFDGEPIAFLPWADQTAPVPAPVNPSVVRKRPTPPPTPAPSAAWSSGNPAADLVREIRQQMVATHSVVMETQRVLQENTLARTESLLEGVLMPEPTTPAPPPSTAALPSGPPPPAALEAAPRSTTPPTPPTAPTPPTPSSPPASSGTRSSSSPSPPAGSRTCSAPSSRTSTATRSAYGCPRPRTTSSPG